MASYMFAIAACILFSLNALTTTTFLTVWVTPHSKSFTQISKTPVTAHCNLIPFKSNTKYRFIWCVISKHFFHQFKASTSKRMTHTHNMRSIDEHKVSGFCCYRVTEHTSYQTPPFVYSGPNVMNVFYDHVMSETEAISHIIRDNVSMHPLTDEQQTHFDQGAML